MKQVLFLLIILLIAVNLSAVNQMAQMTFMSGEFAGSEFGNAMASIDFNGDGYRDLVVASYAWNPTLVFGDQNRWGKLYFYWGGPGFDNVPDFVIEGTYVNQLGNTNAAMSLYNAGDMNNDGVDDLVVDQRSSTYDCQVAVYYGRTVPQTTPDALLTFPFPEVDWILIAPLGDINGDNHDDVSIVQFTPSYVKTYIWSDVTSQPWLFKQSNNPNWRVRLSGIGDVNGDSLSDVYLHTPIYGTGGTHNRKTVFKGSLSFPQTDSVVICNDTNAYATETGCPVGDVNGDGIADFVAYDNHLWFGRQNLTAQWDVALSAVYTDIDLGFTEYCTGYPFVHGDFNNDGYKDIAGSNHGFAGNSGVFYIWLGRSQMNGTLDFQHQAPQEYAHLNFGWSKVTGDFNADGFCDIAVGAPWWNENDHTETGRVYLYAGNADLVDTTVENEDNTIPEIDADLWKIEVYPNPVATKPASLNIKFLGSGYKTTDKLSLDVYNIKGQKVYSKVITNSKLREGLCEIKLDSSTTGMLIIKLSASGKALTSAKAIIQ